MQRWGNNQKIVEKSMLLFFNRNLRLEEVRNTYINGSILMCEEQFGKIARLKPGKYSTFPVLSLFFYPSLSKIRHSRSNKNYFFEISKKGQSFCVLSLTLRL